MIKYKIQLGDKVINEEARADRDRLKADLKGMHCRKCGIDTVIEYEIGNHGFFNYNIHACCPEFELRIRKIILPNSV